jgi:hypothetical protein
MPTEQQIDAAAAAAAERANGGKFSDPLFYKAEQRAFWREVVRSALEAAEAPTAARKEEPAQKIQEVSEKEVEDFSEHCVYIRSVYTLMTRIWRDSDADERKTMEAIAPLFFEDIGKVLGEFLVIAACRITDPMDAGRGRQNFTVELFTNSFLPESEAFKKLDELCRLMGKLREKILPTRHKLGAHADRDVIRKGETLPGGSWADWQGFWSALADFVRIINEETFGTPFEIDAGGVLGDAETLLKCFEQSQHFETLLKGNDPKVKDACLKLALPAA